MAPPKRAHASGTPKPKRIKTESSPESRAQASYSADPTASPFQVEYPDTYTKPLKSSKGEEERDDQAVWKSAEKLISPFGQELDQHYAIVPAKEWADMKKYSNFIIQGDTYKNTHFVYVRGAKASGTDPHDFWVGRILQVRAKSAQQVYALIAWMYWPEELPFTTTKGKEGAKKESGKRIYHGRCELIASNYLEVVDVLSLAGKADVEEWKEDGVGDEVPKNQLYWRQTLCRQKLQISSIREHCICDGHFNPDVQMFVCDNDDCKTMLHPDCLLDDALTKKYKAVYGEGANDVAKTKGKGKGKKIYAGKFSGEILFDPYDDSVPTTVKITNLKRGGGETEERLECPKCSTILE